MEKWQLMFINFVIIGFIFQLFFILAVLLVSKALPKEKTDKEILEKIFKKDYLTVYFSDDF
tara:strand:- start:646 stop:828 length:183 start_codon:yes stop_codon:yes gene_type:complete